VVKNKECEKKKWWCKANSGEIQPDATLCKVVFLNNFRFYCSIEVKFSGLIWTKVFML